MDESVRGAVLGLALGLGAVVLLAALVAVAKRRGWLHVCRRATAWAGIGCYGLAAALALAALTSMPNSLPNVRLSVVLGALLRTLLPGAPALSTALARAALAALLVGGALHAVGNRRHRPVRVAPGGRRGPAPAEHGRAAHH